MKYGVYAIYDVLSETYDGLFLFRTELQAQYELTQRIKPERKDFTKIFRVGHFNIETGTIDSLVNPHLIDYYSVPDSVVQTPLNKGSVEQQCNDFAEKTIDIGVRK